MKYKWTAGLGMLVFVAAMHFMPVYKGSSFLPPTTEVSAAAAAVELSHIPPQAPLSLVTEPEDGVTVVGDAIRAAHLSVDLVIYELKDTQVEQALAEAAARGVAVRVMIDDLDNFGRKPNQAAFDFLKSRGVPVEFSPSYFALTHQKTLIVDGKAALIMTFNLTPQYYGSSRDFALTDEDSADVSAIEAAFDADWKGERAAAPIGDDLVWSPGSAQTVLALIRSASTTLDIYNEEMADGRVIAALSDAAARGVKVRVDMTYETSWKSAFRTLTEADVSVRTYASSAKFYIHAKAIIADSSRAFVGSENFSAQSLDENRELGILIERPDIIGSLEATFEKDWAGSRPFR